MSAQISTKQQQQINQIMGNLHTCFPNITAEKITQPKIPLELLYELSFFEEFIDIIAQAQNYNDRDQRSIFLQQRSHDLITILYDEHQLNFYRIGYQLIMETLEQLLD